MVMMKIQKIADVFVEIIGLHAAPYKRAGAFFIVKLFIDAISSLPSIRG
jgi:hypothetical protein